MKIGNKNIRNEAIMFLIVFVAMVIHMYNSDSLEILLDRFYLSSFVMSGLYLVWCPRQKENSKIED